MDLKIVVVLPAGGTGERMGIAKPKQFCRIKDRPLISYTFQAFENIPWIQRIIVPTAADKISTMTEIIQSYHHTKVIVTHGGTTRHRSICNGVRHIEQVEAESPDVVVVHDAVRLFIDEDTLMKIVREAHIHGACGITRPLVSTVIKVNEEGFLSESLDRSKYRASEMPQAFTYQVIKEAYNKCVDHDFDFGTECLHLAQKYAGFLPIRLVEGASNLWKVTHRRDLYAAEGLIKESTNHVALVGFSSEELYSAIEQQILSKRMNIEDKCKDVSKISEKANNIVLCYQEFDSEHILKKTDDIANKKEYDMHGNAEQINPHLDNKMFKSGTKTLIHLVTCNSISNSSERNMQSLRKNLKKVSCDQFCVLVIIAEKESSAAEIGAMVSDLLWNGSMTFSGQILFV